MLLKKNFFFIEIESYYGIAKLNVFNRI